jgi:hypothetical protein
MPDAKFEAMRLTAARHPHGTRTRYASGCHCMLCRAANSRYESGRQLARADGDFNGIVSAEPARVHIAELSKKGVGRHAIAAATDIASSILYGIATGVRKNCRARTLRKILDVDESARGGKSLVEAAPAWGLINELLGRGFSKVQLAEWLGKYRALQIGKRRITADTASSVERMCRLLAAGKLRRTR